MFNYRTQNPLYRELGCCRRKFSLVFLCDSVVQLRGPTKLTCILLQPQDAIDFTDNDIQLLGNFPLSPRLQTLLLARNRITHIQPSIASSIPNLKNLVLTSNNIAELADLDVLSTFPKLTHLVLMENPVTRKEVKKTGKIIPNIIH